MLIDSIFGRRIVARELDVLERGRFGEALVAAAEFVIAVDVHAEFGGDLPMGGRDTSLVGETRFGLGPPSIASPNCR